jgi:hypothetical protein
MRRDMRQALLCVPTVWDFAVAVKRELKDDAE